MICCFCASSFSFASYIHSSAQLKFKIYLRRYWIHAVIASWVNTNKRGACMWFRNWLPCLRFEIRKIYDLRFATRRKTKPIEFLIHRTIVWFDGFVCQQCQRPRSILLPLRQTSSVDTSRHVWCANIARKSVNSIWEATQTGLVWRTPLTLVMNGRGVIFLDSENLSFPFSTRKANNVAVNLSWEIINWT